MPRMKNRKQKLLLTSQPAAGEKMLVVPFPINKNKYPQLTMMDFYRFRHQHKHVNGSDKRTVLSQPLWIVGSSPFDEVISPEEGHIVHLGTPQFTARWTMDEETMDKLSKGTGSVFFEEDFGMMIYEIIPIGRKKNVSEKWLLEAACAIAHAKGMLAISDVDDQNHSK
jgi:hypothetical protein